MSDIWPKTDREWRLVIAQEDEQNNPFPYVLIRMDNRGAIHPHSSERFATMENALSRAGYFVRAGERVEIYKDVAYCVSSITHESQRKVL